MTAANLDLSNAPVPFKTSVLQRHSRVYVQFGEVNLCGPQDTRETAPDDLLRSLRELFTKKECRGNKAFTDFADAIETGDHEVALQLAQDADFALPLYQGGVSVKDIRVPVRLG